AGQGSLEGPCNERIKGRSPAKAGRSKMALPQGMSDAELMILRETEPPELAGLGEDALLDLATRVRRARNKHVGQYRRGAGTKVQTARARGAAYSRSQRARDKAEVFETALARVSTAL